jgi:tRNA-2-methylthio-N6-dimethylallyladenosine synthase
LYRLQELDGLARIRLVTLHPSYLTPALARALAECDKAERFLPLPAQSGSDRVLRAMKRGYTTGLYRARTEALRELVPDVELGSDWIVGFPGESEPEFAESELLLGEQGFAVNYVFQYSPRPGTAAGERLADDVPDEAKRERNRRLLAKAAEVGLARHARHVGEVRRVFVDGASERDPSRVTGRTEHGLAASFEGDASLAGSVALVRIEGASAYGLSGVRC